MHSLKTLIFAGVALVGAVGVAAAAELPKVHELRLALPDGGVEVIHYTGDVAPKVTISDRAGPASFAAFPMIGTMAVEPMGFSWGAPFAAMQRIQAEMRQQTADLLRQAHAMQTEAGSSPQVVAFGAPGGGQSFSFVSTTSGPGFCGHSVQITSMGGGRPAKVVRKTFGDCAGGQPQGAASAAAVRPLHPADAMPVRTTARAPSPSDQPPRVGV